MTRLLLALALLTAGAAGAAHAQSGGNVALTTTPAALIPASNRYTAVRYQVQGVGFACLSWVTASVTITGTDFSAVCGGAGSFLVTAGSVDARLQSIPAGALTGVSAAGAALNVVFEVQP